MPVAVSLSDVVTGSARWCVEPADLRFALDGFPDCSVDAVVCDPPYELGFMGRSWDRSGIAFDPDTWARCLRVAKPGAHLLAFGGTRTWHRIAVAIEDAGWVLRDSIAWMYGSGFPKSLDVSKAIDAAAGAEAAAKWSGYGTALKPAFEPIIVARKPLDGTVAANVLKWGTGGINVDGCRIDAPDGKYARFNHSDKTSPGHVFGPGRMHAEPDGKGRWPANVILDESQAAALDAMSGERTSGRLGVGHGSSNSFGVGNTDKKPRAIDREYGNDSGGASRFYFCPKASTAEREMGLDHLPPRTAGELTGRKDGSAGLTPRAGAGRASQGRRNTHPTVKPVELMRWLVRLVTPPGGLVLDPFTGSGTTGIAAMLEGDGRRFVGVDLDPYHVEIARARIAHVIGGGYQRAVETEPAPVPTQVSLFGGQHG